MKMTIANKLYLGLGVLAAVFVGLAVFSHLNNKSGERMIEEANLLRETQGLIAPRIIDHFKWSEDLAVGALMFGREFTGQLDHTQCNLGKWYYDYKPPAEIEETYRRIEEPHRRVHASAVKIIGAIKEGKSDAARELYQSETIPALRETQDALLKLREELKAMAGKKTADASAAQARMGTTTTAVYILVLAALIAASIKLLVRPIQQNLSAISDWVNTLAIGDLTRKHQIATADEVGAMAASLDSMVDRIKHIIGQTIDSSGQVSVAADQIADANQNFSQRIAEQAASVEETSSTMEEMATSLRQTAENAREANRLAQGTREAAEAGSVVMADTIRAMDEINKSSGRIGSISTVIEEIAFQTNLLALNAAVEAARAGEHGKGFAVVASEIRSLAQRASQSAKEITALIQDSVEKTGRGAQLAQELSKKLDEIGGSVKKVAAFMDEVSAAGQEQASGINQVNTAMGQIDQTTQQNASLVEETASAAEELAAQAKELMNLISFFKVDGDGRLGRPAAKAAPIRAMRPEAPATKRDGGSRKVAALAAAGALTGNGKRDGDFAEF